MSNPRDETPLPSDRAYREIFNATSDALLIHDENGRVLDVNERMCAMLGCDRDAALAQFPWALCVDMPPYSTAEAQEHMRRAIDEGPQVFPWRFRRVDGETFWVEVALRACKIDGRRWLIASVRDLTLRKEMEDALRRNEAVLSSMLQATPAGVAFLVDRVFQRVNASLCKMSGYSDEELVGRNSRILYPSEEAFQRVGQQLRDGLSNGCVSAAEAQMRRKDGSLLDVLLHASPFDPSNLGAGVTCTVWDISERKRAEEALNAHVHEVERFNRLATARELRMLELKRRVNEMSREVGRPEPYPPLPDNSPAESTQGEPTPPAAALGSPWEYGLADLLDRARIQEMLDSFCDLVGVSGSISDPQGEVFVVAHWRRICTEFHRAHPCTRERCIQSDTILSSQLKDGEEFSLYRCHNGLMTAAAPIIIEDRHVGNAFIGQYFVEPPDPDFFRRQAAEFGFDETSYLEALAEVPVLSREKLPAIMRYLTSAARLAARMGLERLRGKTIEADLQRRAAEVEQVVRQLRDQRSAAINLAEDAFEARDAARAAQRSLRESEERLRGITSAALDAIVMIDERGCISFWNHAAETMFGLSRAQALGQDLHQTLVPKRYRQASHAGLMRFFRSGEGPALGRTLELTAQRANGEEFPIELSVASVQLQGKLHAVGTIRDITTRKLAEDQIRSAQQQLRDIIEFLPDATFVIDQQKKVVAWNRAVEQLTGVRKQDILGKDTYSLCFYDEQRPILIDMVLQTNERFQEMYTNHGVKDGEVFGETYVPNARNGKGAVCWGIASRLFDSQGNTIGAIESIRDVTERKRAEEALRDSEDRYRALVNNLKDVLYSVDAEGKLTFIGPQVERYGFQVEELIGQDFASLILEEDRPAVLRDFLHSLSTGEDAPSTFRAVTKDGNIHWFEEIGQAVLDSDGQNVVAISGVLRDVTDRKRAEEALQQAKEAAEAANRAKSAFLANMSHEIRTPMTSILGYTDVLIEESIELKSLEHLQVIKQNGEHLLQVINDILNLSAIESGKWHAEVEACSPSELIAGVVEMMHGRAEAKGIALHVDYPEDVPARIRTDPVRFRQILVNLVGNAIKFTEQGSVRVVVRQSDDRSRLSCEVRDTGIGIAADQVVNLFQPFSQVDASPTRRFGGTGLGLVISKSLAERLGGELVLVTSQLGHGSQFRLTLPVDSPEKDSPAGGKTARHAENCATDTPPLADSALQGRHLLLAEDGLDNQRLIALILRKAGAEVTVVENGQRAVEAVLSSQQQGTPPDVVLMDMQMPVLDGYQAVQQLRRAGYTGQVVALTAHAMDDDRQRCLDAGCDDYLTKPVDRHSLIATIARLASADVA